MRNRILEYNILFLRYTDWLKHKYMKLKMLKIGDKIRIKGEGFFEEFPVMPNHTIRCYGLDVTPEMRKYWGQEATVVEIDTTGKIPMYGLSVDHSNHWWNIEMLEWEYGQPGTTAVLPICPQ